jgi:hypothetical protein
MDWRAYFTVSPVEMLVEKINVRHKPRGADGGQFDTKNGWGITGFGHTDAKITAAGGAQDFNKLSGKQQQTIVKKAIISLNVRGGLVGGVGAAGGKVTASDITAAVSQATGTFQGKALSNNVTGAIRQLQKNGEISIQLKTQRIASEGGHWVYKDVATGKTVLNPMTGKPARGNTISGAKEVATRDVHTISLTASGSRSLKGDDKKGYQLNQSLSVTRPVKFDPVKGSYAEKALAIRQKTFPNSQLAPQGRVHSNDKDAPEMLTGKELEKKYPKLAWYDATSSARANVGAMTGNQELLNAVKLSKTNPKTPAMATAAKLGLTEPDKPYYALLNPSNGKGKEITRDMMNIGNLLSNPKGMKDVVKKVDTPRLYGARENGTINGATKEILKQAGFGNPTKENPSLKPATAVDKAKAKALATTLVKNFRETPIAQFEEKFKGMAKEMPNNFVYTNPVSGFRMSFQKHENEAYRPRMKANDGKEFQMSIKTPGEPSPLKSRNSTMPLFVQSFDAAVKDIVTVKLNNPYTKHDAFAVPKVAARTAREGTPGAVKKLKATVAGAYEQINRVNPIKDLGEQMKKQWKGQIGKTVVIGGTAKNPKRKLYTADDYVKTVKNIDNAVNNFFPKGKPPAISIPPDTGHLELE